MKTFVLCGGLGTRLRPHTYKVPKPMLPISGKPILQHVIENLKASGLTDIVLTIGYLKEQIIGYFGDGSKFGVHLEYVEEKEAQNTAGSILLYKGKVESTFVVVMGDHFTDVNVKRLVDFHKAHKAIATIAVMEHTTKIDFGVVTLSGNHVSEFVEKPALKHNINIGMYVFEPEIFKYIEAKEDFAKNVFPRLLSSGKQINACNVDGKWHDVGRLEDYEKLNNEFGKKK